MKDLVATFKEYFEVIPADTPERLAQAFHLRYQVYCEEGRIPDFDDPSQYPDQMETDSYDRRSVHYLYRHRASGMNAGTVRLILANPEDPQIPFPIEEFAANNFYPERVDLQTLPRHRIGEISRLLLAKNYRMRPGEVNTTHGLVDNFTPPTKAEDRRRFPHAILGLFVAIVRMSTEQNLTHWYAGMEPSLARLLRRFGIYFQDIGPITEYHGPRQPFLGVIEEVMKGIYEQQPDVWDLLTDGGNIWPAPRL